MRLEPVLIVNEAELCDILADAEKGTESPERLKRQFREWADWTQPADAPIPIRSVEVVGDPIGMDPVEYHIDCLLNLDWRRNGSEGVRTKVRYHLRMLSWAMSPEDESRAPLVSVVIPVYNGRDCIGRAIASALAQTHPRVEIVVVDDGSTDGTAELAESIEGPIQVVRQENRGAAAARNRGVREARGEFVQFLDADDELLPTAVSDKVAAIARTPDARLCYSRYTCVEGSEFPTDIEQTPIDSPRSAVWDPMLAACSRFPFQISTALAPRWYLEYVGPFEEDLRQSEDVRYYFQMARRGLKAIATRGASTRRHGRSNSLTRNVVEARRWAIEADFRSAEELAREPRLYRYLVCLLTRATWLLDRAYDEGMPQETIEGFHGRMLEFEASVGRGVASAEGLTALLIDQLMMALRRKCAQTTDATRPMIRLWHERELQLLDRLGLASAVTGSDLRRWLPDLRPRPFVDLRRSEQAALQFALEQLQTTLTLGELAIRPRLLERVGADYPGHPYERYWRSVSRLARVLGDDVARTLSRQKVFRGGWQAMGRARRLVGQSRAG